MKRHTLLGATCLAAMMLTTTLAAMMLTSTASAQEVTLLDTRSPKRLTGLELWGGVGVAGHNTTGVGAPLDEYGYARSPGPGAEAGLRMLFGTNRYFRHGLTLRGTYQAGRRFGRDGYGFRFGLADAGYTFRTNLPCMSDGKRQFYAGGTLGVTGGYADAGTGRGPMDVNENARNSASTTLDHVALGWVLGGHIDVHYGPMLVGLSIDLRRLYGLETSADRHMVSSAMLRAGLAFDWAD